MNGHIYMLIDLRNGKKYIGKHDGSNPNYFTGGKIPKRIIKKYGKDVFSRNILESGISNLKELDEKERDYISRNRTFEDGYNLTKGGDGGGSWIYKLTEEEKKLLTKKKSEGQKGRRLSKEHKAKLSTSHKGKVLSEEHKKNISKNSARSFLGKQHTQKTKDRISKLKRGVKNPKHAKWMEENNPRKVQVSIHGKVYDSIKDASDALCMKRHNVKTRLISESPKWKYWYKIK